MPKSKKNPPIIKLSNESAALIIQKRWRVLLRFKRKVDVEVLFFRKTLKNIISRINESHKQNIISMNEYKKLMNQINVVISDLDFYPARTTVTFLKSYSNYTILLSLAKIKIKIIDITNNSGSVDINNLISLYLGDIQVQECVNESFMAHIEFFKSLFKIIKCELYETNSDNNITFKLRTHGKNNKTNSITLSSYQLDKPSVNKYNVFTKNLILKTMGAKIFVPVKGKLLILYGYFINDDMNQYKKEPIFDDKCNKINELFQNIDINENFRKNFLESMSITDFLLNSPNQIASNCITYHTDLIKFKAKNISQIVKEFIINEVDKQRYMITLLLLDTSDSDSIYLAHLLFDLLKSDHQASAPRNSTIIFDSLHWHLKKIFRDGDEVVQEVNDKISNFNEERIPYEKRIHLMKADDYVKSKAMDKLKEINNSKNGESNAKAQQYLDGLLKIPFGNYKKEVIRYKLDELIIKYDKLVGIISRDVITVEEQYSLCDGDLQNTENLNEIIDSYKKSNKNPSILNKINIRLKKWIQEVLLTSIQIDKLYVKSEINTKLKKIKVPELKEILGHLSIKASGSKGVMINNLLSHKFGTDEIKYLAQKLNLKKKYIRLQDTDQFLSIVTSLEQLSNLWSKYLESQSKYFKEVSNRLDKSVYGLSDAKNQIKRLLAQWVNGNDQGYVFGFEGPPGTGKTTLAKQGIAHCLRDELDKTRPFVFIALGGSSNGSTLEGHNYTYVGSTWGRIIEGIIDSKIMNPIIYIDELDKISKTEHGKEIIGILTHLTDPSQNTEFTDKYFSGIKFDISKCLIIFSYNDPALIDKILLDRIQRIRINPLNKVDKVMVAKKHIIPEILNNVGMTEHDIILEDNELMYLIDTYTYEAGARKLKEKLYEIYREINLQYLTDSVDFLPFKIEKDFIDKVFENYDKVDIKLIHNKPKAGLVNGLFATAAGIGGITVIETYKFISSAHLELKLTGMQGDVMKESMSVAKTLALNLIPLDILEKLENVEDSNKFGIHIHCPEGATPKDGPSAGTAITVAIISLLCDIPVINTMALTGEISLNGNVMPIGGLESKVDGAKAAGVKHVLCPIKNEKDLKKIRKRINPPEDDNFKVTMIDNIYQALNSFLMIPNNKTAEEYFRKI